MVKLPEQVELERKTADYIARKVEEPPQLKSMARKLSESLGRPKKQISDSDPVEETENDNLIDWQKVLLAQQEQLDKLNKALVKFEGKKIEDTGVNVFGFSMGGAAIALVVLCVLFPPVATVLWVIFKRVSGALFATAQGIKNYVKDNPDAGEKLKVYLGNAQDKAHKEIISKIKTKL